MRKYKIAKAEEDAQGAKKGEQEPFPPEAVEPPQQEDGEGPP